MKDPTDNAGRSASYTARQRYYAQVQIQTSRLCWSSARVRPASTTNQTVRVSLASAVNCGYVRTSRTGVQHAHINMR